MITNIPTYKVNVPNPVELIPERVLLKRPSSEPPDNSPEPVLNFLLI